MQCIHIPHPTLNRVDRIDLDLAILAHPCWEPVPLSSLQAAHCEFRNGAPNTN